MHVKGIVRAYRENCAISQSLVSSGVRPVLGKKTNINQNALKEPSGLFRVWKHLLIVQLTTEMVLSSEMDPTVSGINRKVVLTGAQA